MSYGTSVITAVIAVYLAAMMGISVLAYRRTRDFADYILGGRRLGFWVSALSAEASDMSGWLMLGLPGFAYLFGFQAGWIALGLLVGTYLNWRLVARRLRRYTELAGNALTLPDFFERRFDDRSRVLRVITAFFILLFFAFYTSSGFVAGGKVFQSVFGLDYRWAVAAGAFVVVGYTFVGGFFAVCWTDSVQGLMMVIALLALPLTAIVHQGGWGGTLAALADSNTALLNPLQSSDGRPLSTIALASLLGWGLGYFGQPHILPRFMAIRSEHQIRQARWVAVSWVSLTLVGAVLVGIAGVGYFHPPLSGPESEKVFIKLSLLLFHPLVAGVLLAAILAAIMSTASAQLLVSASALSEDFYKALLRPGAGPRELLWVGRGAVLGISGIAYGLALNPGSQVLELVAHAWAGFGAAFGPAILLSLFWRRMTRNGALAGVVVGGLTVVVWQRLSGGIFDLYELVPGFAFSLAAIVAVSLLDRRPEARIEEQFRTATAGARVP
jgi:sodium/proline symporter